MLAAFDQVFAVLESHAVSTSDGFDADAKAKAIDQARQDRDYAAADALRAELEAAGYEVKTTKAGTVATKKLA